jgi:arsenical resistance operon trans-acting repressor ArsD
MRITVIRSVPAVIIGTVGVVPNHEFDAFEARLDAVEASGVIVERFQPDQAAVVDAQGPAVQQLVTDRGAGSFPLVLVNGEIVSSGRYPTSTEWAHALGSGRRAEEMIPTR